jgi:transcriptional regulator with XRE-family HTH domain
MVALCVRLCNYDGEGMPLTISAGPRGLTQGGSDEQDGTGEDENMTTQFGKELKKLRIDLGITLMEMAKKIDVSAAFLSALETGRKRIPDGTLDVLAARFPEIAKERGKFEVLINQARREVTLPLPDASFEDAKLATALARRFSTMSAEDKERIRNLITME